MFCRIRISLGHVPKDPITALFLCPRIVGEVPALVLVLRSLSTLLEFHLLLHALKICTLFVRNNLGLQLIWGEGLGRGSFLLDFNYVYY